jgi:hypothetical protein
MAHSQVHTICPIPLLGEAFPGQVLVFMALLKLTLIHRMIFSKMDAKASH